LGSKIDSLQQQQQRSDVRDGDGIASASNERRLVVLKPKLRMIMIPDDVVELSICLQQYFLVGCWRGSEL
jgi:hypothetical protein